MSHSSRRNFLKTSAIGVATIASHETLAASPEVRKITPPNLDEAYLGQKILCYRPMRHGSPNLSVVNVNGKAIPTTTAKRVIFSALTFQQNARNTNISFGFTTFMSTFNARILPFDCDLLGVSVHAVEQVCWETVRVHTTRFCRDRLIPPLRSLQHVYQ